VRGQGATNLQGIDVMRRELLPPMKEEPMRAPPPPWDEERRLPMVRNWRDIIVSRQDSSTDAVKKQLLQMQQVRNPSCTRLCTCESTSCN
jgi:hypothetical protein